MFQGQSLLCKYIRDLEKESGHLERVCRKSVQRLLDRMAKAEQIKKYEVVIPYDDGTTANIVYFCDANISMEDEFFKDALNQTKFRLKGIGKFVNFVFCFVWFKEAKGLTSSDWSQ